MNEPRDQALSLAFMRSHPVQAARVLESLPVAQAAALFTRAPARLGASVLAAMLPQWAARCVDGLDDPRALELLAPMGTQPTVAVLRHLAEPRRRQLVAGLPTAVAMASTLLLGFAEDALGAWADPDVVVLGADARVADALEHARLAPPTHALIFVADAHRRLGGLVPLAALLQAPEGARLSTLMQRPAAVLAAHAALASAPAHPAWERVSVLPVVEPGERLVGVMTRDALARALRRAAAPEGGLDPDPPSSFPAALTHGYWQALSGFIEVTLALLPRVRPVQGDGDGR